MSASSPLTPLRQEHELIASLLDLLREEQQCLVRADTDSLERLTPRKLDLVQRMADLGKARHQALGAAGFPAQDEGTAAWLAAQGDAAARQLWDELLARTREAKELNRVNGMLINKHMVGNQILLNAMRTPAAGGDAATYGRSGQPVGAGPSRRFVLG